MRGRRRTRTTTKANYVGSASQFDLAKANRDSAAEGCSECFFPREKDRANSIVERACKDLTTNNANANSNNRALIIGAETGELVDAFLRTGVAQTVLCVDVSELQTDRARERTGDVGVSGNAPGATYFVLEEGEVCSLRELKPFYGPFDVVIFNDTYEDFGLDAIAYATTMLKQRGQGMMRGGAAARVVICSREEKEGDDTYKRATKREIREAIGRKGLPLAWSKRDAERGKTIDFVERGEEVGENAAAATEDALDTILTMYLTKNYKLAKPLRMQGTVVRGFGRGSAKMGLPTANLDPDEVSRNWRRDRGKKEEDDAIDVKNIPLGVYFGYCKLLPGDDRSKKKTDDSRKIAVLNVGRRPSFVDKKDYENDVTVEVHCVEEKNDNLAYEKGTTQFYGEKMEVTVLGFVRPEMRFDNIDDLVARIKTDVGLSKNSIANL